ncbi:MAG: relaxase domain-containing protein [Opitutaceae bacterium]|jgi:conjugative relaxase-like TrwC/TraI family protein|nr:relaxase domain-containing protein [Opitutaceae bacterium]
MVRFDQPCFAVKGAVEYFREHMALGDYLTQEGQAEMTWFGEGAKRLGLSGQCDLQQFENLCRGQHPLTGVKLTVRDKGASRRVCFFGQISPPKDVSVLHLVGGDARIGEWWHEAVAEALGEMESVAATRVRKGGKNSDRQTGNVIAAIVTHDANRSLDPQLHTHLCFMNLTWDEAEGRWKGLQPSGLYRHQGYFREVCYNRLAMRMREAGYEIEPVRQVGFTIKGLPPALRDIFSKRRRKILQEAAAAGVSSQDGLQQVALLTREGKTNATAVTLRARWLTECGEHRSGLEATIAAADGASRRESRMNALEALHSAEAHVFERRSVVQDRLLLREALVAGRGEIDLGELKRALAARERSGELLRSEDEIASCEGLAAEAEFTGWAYTRRESCGRLGREVSAGALSPNQSSAVAGLLDSRSAVTILQGDAGTGKTTCLKVVVDGVERDGGRVFGCAPSSGAAQVLRQELTAEAETLQQLLVNEPLQQSMRGRVILVDEAGLISVREMRDLCRLAVRNDNRLLLVGDTKQHHSVEAGDALRALQCYGQIPIFRLTEIRRQRDPAYRQAVALLARGNAFGAFNRFNRLGAVREVRGSALWTTAAADNVRTLREGKTCLAISPVWREIHLFTAAVREQLKLAGLLSREERIVTVIHSLKWTREEKRRVRSYQPGDVISFHRAHGIFRKFETATVRRGEGSLLVVSDALGAERRLDPRNSAAFDVGLPRDIAIAQGERLLIRANLPAAHLQNGDLTEVSGFSAEGAVLLKDGRALPSWFRDFSHGYATTSHAAQGKTVDRGLLLMADDGIAAGNLKQAYVSNSRFRESQMIYTTDKTAAREAMMRPSDRKLATELVGPADAPAPSRSGWRAQWKERLAPLLRIAA